MDGNIQLHGSKNMATINLPALLLRYFFIAHKQSRRYSYLFESGKLSITLENLQENQGWSRVQTDETYSTRMSKEIHIYYIQKSRDMHTVLLVSLYYGLPLEISCFFLRRSILRSSPKTALDRGTQLVFLSKYNTNKTEHDIIF